MLCWILVAMIFRASPAASQAGKSNKIHGAVEKERKTRHMDTPLFQAPPLLIPSCPPLSPAHALSLLPPSRTRRDVRYRPQRHYRSSRFYGAVRLHLPGFVPDLHKLAKERYGRLKSQVLGTSERQPRYFFHASGGRSDLHLCRP